ncbi:MAG: InlB B-repeat-containing protein [Clostridiales bacterium]|jgi:hypothetical protein|nr:InlB B-repeat-containing protein [Clostridiales bacterium]
MKKKILGTILILALIISLLVIISAPTPAEPTCTVTFIASGPGIFFEIERRELPIGGSTTHPEPPDVSGYTFIGWSTPSYYLEDITFNITVYANYEKNPVVTFAAYSPDLFLEIESREIPYGSSITSFPAPPDIPGYTFTNWDTPYQIITNITSDMTFYANYVKNPVVNFAAYGPNLFLKIESREIPYGGSITSLPAPPDIPGYTFTNWDTPYNKNTNITSDMTLYAHYAETPVVSFAANGPDLFLEIESREVPYGSLITSFPAPPDIPGYTFLAWDTYYSDLIDITYGITIYANYVKNPIVTFAAYGPGLSLEIESREVPYGGSTIPPTPPSIPGYTFLEWDSYYSDLIDIKYDITLQAEYIENPVIAEGFPVVTFITDEVYGYLVIESRTVPYGSPPIPAVPPSIPGYTFIEWESSFLNMESITDNITVRANYQKNPVVTFVAGNVYGYPVIETREVSFGSPAIPPTPPNIPGYSFVKWDFDYTSLHHITEDITVQAIYQQNPVVTFVAANVPDYPVIETSEVSFGSPVVPPAPPCIPGYTFESWHAWSDSLDHVTGDITVRAIYQKNPIVTFITDNVPGYPVIESREVPFGSPAVPPTPPTIPGYTFLEWDLPLNHMANLTDDITVYAWYDDDVVYKPTLVVTFIATDNYQTVIESCKVPYGGSTTLPVAPDLRDYTFIGWHLPPGGLKNITYDLIVYAEYKANPVVTFVATDNYRSVIDYYEVSYGGSATTPEAPDIYGYTFTAWHLPPGGLENITYDLTVYAEYKANPVVTFVATDNYQSFIDYYEVPYGGSATTPIPPDIYGYTFLAWHLPPGGLENITYDLTVFAEYKANPVVEFVAITDYYYSTFESHEVAYGGSVTTPTPPDLPGYIFVSWYLPSGGLENIIYDLTVYAEYKIAHEVIFTDWDGRVLKTQIVAEGAGAEAPAPPMRTGYTFTGWKPDFSYITGPLTVEAEYKINYYDVTFVDWDGSILDQQSIAYLNAAEDPDAPQRHDHYFIGWDLDYSCITDHLTVTAQYVPWLTTDKNDADGIKIPSNSHIYNAGPGVVFYWDQKQKDEGVLEIAPAFFDTYASLTIVVKSSNEYRKITVPVSGSFEVKKWMDNKGKEHNINMVWIRFNN